MLTIATERMECSGGSKTEIKKYNIKLMISDHDTDLSNRINVYVKYWVLERPIMLLPPAALSSSEKM